MTILAKRVRVLQIAVTWSFIVSAALAAALAFSVYVPRDIKARQFTVVNRDGSIVALLGTSAFEGNGYGIIETQTAEGKTLARLDATADGGRIRIKNKSGIDVLDCAVVNGGGGSMELKQGRGRRLLDLYSTDTGSAIMMIGDRKGEPAFILGENEGGGPWMSLAHRDGNPLWTISESQQSEPYMGLYAGNQKEILRMGSIDKSPFLALSTESGKDIVTLSASNASTGYIGLSDFKGNELVQISNALTVSNGIASQPLVYVGLNDTASEGVIQTAKGTGRVTGQVP